MNDNLPELRDIHLPEGVSPFPLSYGWYVLLFGIIGLYLLIRLYGWWQLKSRKLYANKVINEIDETAIIDSSVKISELLRRICVYKYPQAVALSDKEWLDFLQNHCKNKLPAQSAELLKNAPYMNPKKNNFAAEDLKNLLAFAKNWVGENL